MNRQATMLEFLAFIAEIVIELIIQWPADKALSRRERRADEEDVTARYGMAVAAAVLSGAAGGWISAWIWPGLWPESGAGRAALLVGAPLLVGGISYLINTTRKKRGGDWLRPGKHAACAAVFAFTWAIVRASQA